MNKQISKSLAHDIASKLVLHHRDRLRADIRKLNAEVHDYFIRQLPDEVTEFNNLFPDYANYTKTIYLSGLGFNYQIFELPKRLPYKGNKSFNTPAEYADDWVNRVNKHKQRNEEIDELQLNIEATLLSLKSYKNIASQFPEAIPHWPQDEQPKGLAINLESLRQQLAA